MTPTLEKLSKWRMILAGWHAGTQSIHSDGVRAMRDLMDKFLVTQVSQRTLTELLLEKGVFSEAEYEAMLDAQAAALDRQLEAFFPGFRTTRHGVQIDDPKLAAETTRRLGFPP